MPCSKSVNRKRHRLPYGRAALKSSGKVGKTPSGEAAAPSSKGRKRSRARKVQPETRRQAILDAALSVFAERGFEAARLDDVAARAGVAKGTLYLYFRDKEALFEELVRGAVAPIIERVSRAASCARRARRCRCSRPSSPCSRRRCWAPSASSCCASSSPRARAFPAIAEFYYREVVTRGIALMRTRRRARRAPGRVRHRRGRALPATDRRAAAGGGDLGRPVCQDRSPRCRRTAARAPARCSRASRGRARHDPPSTRLLALSAVARRRRHRRLRLSAPAAGAHAVPGLDGGLFHLRQPRRGRVASRRCPCARAMP